MLCSVSLVQILSVEQTKTMEPAGEQSKTLVTGRAREWSNMPKSCTQRLCRYLSRSLSILLAQEGRGKRSENFVSTYGAVASNLESTAYLSLTVKKKKNC